MTIEPRRATLLAIALASLGACSAPPSDGPFVTRQATAGIVTLQGQTLDRQERVLQDQAEALSARTQEILRKATLRGAGLGAAAGCGLGVVVGTGAHHCLQNAVVGGAMGGIAGYAAGQTQIDKRVEIVALSPLVPSLAKAADSVDAIKATLPAVLEAQEAEMTAMRAAHKAGTLSDRDYSARLSEISATRSRLVAALDLSVRQTASARAALMTAQAQGQSGMDWHVFETRRIEQAASSSRASISLIGPTPAT